MNPTLVKAVAVVTVALICYSLAVITEQRRGYLNSFILTFLTLGVVFDISSTVLMIIGSGKIPITIHGFLGYSALSAMLVDTVLVWRHRWRHGRGTVSPRLGFYTRVAYGWWVLAYLAGAIIAMTL